MTTPTTTKTPEQRLDQQEKTLADLLERVDAIETEVRGLLMDDGVFEERFRRSATAARRLASTMDPSAWEATSPPEGPSAVMRKELGEI